ncbi:hypothetical protein [Pseudomonas alkylphenolica]|uniref:Uncharacterized protein n=1 Tax=Pseudomonas alkylphenolica TaxID=237609 RepID=A0A077FCX9_9PSED|nr:hypothetical protein [Pseudomonas alkylphenolica]AIL62495.1 hypothetical protein PSAKL28_33350 [Pseudomonas alkylphenolica]
MQKPTCDLIRDDKKTYLKLVLPGISTQEMDQRKLQLQAYQQGRDNYIHQPYRPTLPPVRWNESTAIWATRFIVVSEEQQALTLHLPIHNCEQTSIFALAFTIAYQLEAERDVFHHTTFVLRDLHITRSYGVTIMTQGTYRLGSVENMPPGTGKAPFKLFIRDDLATANV